MNPSGRLLGGALSLASLWLLAACGKQEAPQAVQQAVPVQVVKTVAQDLPITFEFVGQTQSDQAVDIRGRVSGFLVKRGYKEGAMVKAGQLLFEIDHKPFQAQLDAAKAQLAQERARLEVARANLARVKPLAERNALSAKDLDDATGNYHAAAAGVEQARAQVEEQQLNLSYTYVRSPVDGVSSFAVLPEGAYVSPTNSLLTTVSTLTPMRINFSISEPQTLEFRAEQANKQLVPPPDQHYEVTVVLADGSEYPQKGRITFADATYNQQTGTFLVRAEMPNQEGVLRPGQFVRVLVNGAKRPAAIVVPQRAVVHGPKGDLVFVVDKDSKATPRPVTVGDLSGSMWRISQGLGPGETVVVDGASKIAPGATVKITGEAPPAAVGAGSVPAPASAPAAKSS
ncbi:cation/multidrug efflux system, mebrane-fusion component [Cupriavidus basilensis OR16]|uniref:Cation/multidrug efflux system, mebrane-fusion component n=1 Tax=Cupriavidus basilensis OR16 TaxID=1127483 RepID=H1SEM2_9BURK|nr:efflux RND transporter periplasmic adaptor subunit [Cupriavidus basilensis]EHP39081.1 cation/multidrug efflux system, mebrane-fusion component [Cupriavidus basilensis OR16]